MVTQPTGKRLLLIISSPRKKGTSYSFARTFASLAAAAGCTVEMEYAYDYYDGKRDLALLQERVAGSDLIGMFSPLYYDTLPGVAVWLLEQMDRCGRPALQGKGFFSIAQGAYPFAELCQPLTDSCRCFAEATGMRWLGGIGYGGGVLLDGAFLETLGKKGKKITRALDIALGDLLAGRMISGAAQELLLIRVPKLLYWPLALAMDLRIWLHARRLGVKDLGRKVYLEG